MIQKRKELQRKLELLKQDQTNEDRKFLPITKHLETIADKLDKKNEPNQQLVKTEYNEAPAKNEPIFKSPRFSSNKRKRVFEDNTSTPKFPSKRNTLNFEDNTNTSKNSGVRKKLIFEDKTSTPVSNKRRISQKLTNLMQKIEEMKDDKISIEEEPSNLIYPETSSLLKTEVADESFHYQHDPSQERSYDFDELVDKAVVESRNNIEHIIGTNLYDEYLDHFDPLPKKYIDAMLHDTKNRDFDHRTGVRHDSLQEKFFVGLSEVKFVGPNIQVGDVLFTGTPGLYELIFKNKPANFTESDSENYKQILEMTSAHKRNFDPTERTLGTKKYKYRSIVGPLISSNTPVRFGKGMFKEFNNNLVDYMYWDNPNELVDRLRLLVASQTAGHTGHNNEIVSIIEELRESRIIK